MRLVHALPCLSLLIACGEPGLVDADVRLGFEHADRTSRALTGTTACSAASCTPVNLSGRIFSGGAMWGELGPEAFQVTMLGADADVIQDPSHGQGGSLEFSLIEATVLGAQYAAPPAGDEPKPVTRMEFNYDFIDATFDLEDGAMVGTWIVRTVFVDTATSADVVGVMSRGDKLVRRPGESTFEWCGDTACSVDRSALTAVMQAPAVADYTSPGEGNPAYVPFAVPVANELTLSGDDLAEPGTTWSVAFDMSGAIRLSTPPAEIDSRSALLGAFELMYDPSPRSEGGEPTISVDLQRLD